MHESSPLSFETLLRDPLVRSVMRSDGVSVADLLAVLGAARTALAARERQAARRALAGPRANGPAVDRQARDCSRRAGAVTPRA